MNDKIMFAGKAKEVRPFFESRKEQTAQELFDNAPEFPYVEVYFDEDEMSAQDLIDSLGDELL